jgi:hypothetical protein
MNAAVAGLMLGYLGLILVMLFLALAFVLAKAFGPYG